MASTFEVDSITAITTDSNITIKGKGSGKVSIGDGNLLFPDSDGSSDQVIKTNGSGVLSFADAAGGGGGGGGGAWNLIGTAVASGSASLTVTGLDSTYDTYAIAIADLVPAGDSKILRLRLGDSSGIDSGGSDYDYHTQRSTATSNTYFAVGNPNISFIEASTQAIGNAAGEGYGGLLYLHRPGDGTMQPIISGTHTIIGASTNLLGGMVLGKRNAVITVDRIQVLFNSGNIATGRMTVWGISHT